MYDKDAPTGLGWMHWVVANIPAHVSALPENQPLPQGALQTRTDGGTAGFMGACPPKGQNHRYEITVTAVDVATLPNITADATPALVGFSPTHTRWAKPKLPCAKRDSGLMKQQKGRSKMRPLALRQPENERS